MVLEYEEQLLRWEGVAYARPELSIRITDGHQRLVTHIPVPVGLARHAQEVWLRDRREQALSRFEQLTGAGPKATAPLEAQDGPHA